MLKERSAREKAIYDKAVILAEKGDAKSIEEAINMLCLVSYSERVEKKVEALTVQLALAKEKESREKTERLFMEALQQQYNEKYHEVIPLIKDRDNILYRCKAAKENLGRKKIKPWMQYLIAIVCLALSIWLGKENYKVEMIVEFVCGVFFAVRGLRNWTERQNLKKEIEECQDKINMLDSIPTFEAFA